METTKSLEIIQSMISESKQSMVRNSFHFILWAGLLVPAGMVEFFMRHTSFAWVVWPVMGVIGGIIATIYGKKESKRVGATTIGDRIMAYTWGGFVLTLVFAILYSVSLQQPPHALVLLLAGLATFINGGISNFRPFVWGAVALFLGAITCGFLVDAEYHSIVFAVSILFGYLVPGLQLRRLEHGKAE